MTQTLAAPAARQSITLYYREGSSDKIYTAAVESQADGFVVTFAFGRRGAALQTGTKTSNPVSFEQAKKIYDKLVREKQAKVTRQVKTARRISRPPNKSA